jgi:hypothetical protein
MVALRVDCTRAIADLTNIANRVDMLGYAGWSAMIREATEAAKEHGYHDRTGTLSRSMRGEADYRGQYRWAGRFIAAAPYAIFVDEPTKPHPIRARRVPLLRFFWPKVGAWVAFKSVNHPGTKGAFFTDGAASVALNYADQIISRSIGSEFR